MKKTGYKKTYNLPLTIICFIIVIGIILVCGYLLYYYSGIKVSDTGRFQSYFEKNIILFLLVIVIMFSLSSLINSIKGIIMGSIHNIKEDRFIKDSNPYIYLRELPNNYGIGVNSLLMDSTIENYKDIVAVILDLCARGYFKLVKDNDRYIISVLKKVDSNLLSNERYIYNLVINNDIMNIDYKEWYNLCVNDGTRLGLYYYGKKEGKKVFIDKSIFKKRRIIQIIISFIISCIIFVILFKSNSLLASFLYSFILLIFIYLLLYIPVGIINIITLIRVNGKNTYNTSYSTMVNNNLSRTNEGINELYKLLSFKNFLSDFGSFVNKRVDEVSLWNRYLSYAHVFGLTKLIMHTGYKEIISNSSFVIDDFNNLKLDNIERVIVNEEEK